LPHTHFFGLHTQNIPSCWACLPYRHLQALLLPHTAHTPCAFSLPPRRHHLLTHCLDLQRPGTSARRARPRRKKLRCCDCTHDTHLSMPHNAVDHTTKTSAPSGFSGFVHTYAGLQHYPLPGASFRRSVGHGTWTDWVFSRAASRAPAMVAAGRAYKCHRPAFARRPLPARLGLSFLKTT